MKATGKINLEIKGKNKALGYAFNMKHRRLFMERRGIQFFSEYGQTILNCIPEKDQEMNINQLYIFGDLLLTAIQSVEGETVDLDTDELLEQLIVKPEEIQKVLTEFLAAQEQEKKGGKTSSQGKSKKK